MTPVIKGSMQLDGRPLTGLTPREIIDAGLGFVPEDRKQDGFVGTFTVAENLILNHYDEPPYARGIALDLSKMRQNADPSGGRVRHSDAVDRGTCVVPLGRQPAKGGLSPRALSTAGASWSRASQPGDLTSEQLSSCIGG